ncbi:MAG: penicillin-binding protein 2 [Pseudomonadota bacterium]
MNGPALQARTPIKDSGHEVLVFRIRTLLAILVIAMACLLLVGRLTYLTIVQHDQYRALSADNSLRVAPLTPTRGLILDRNGQVLADNRPVWQLVIVPERVADLDATLQSLQREGLIDATDVERFDARAERSQRFESVTLRSDLSDVDVARFAVVRPRYPGVAIEARLLRYYPHGTLAAHAIGYVGGLSSADLNSLERPDNYAGTRQIGKVGVEQHYEAALHGEVGHHQLLTTATGRALESRPGDAPEPGRNLWLTIDLGLQQVAEAQLEGVRGAVVALEPATGDVLAMASSPSFDPNAFAAGLGQQEFAALRNDLDRPLFDRVLRGRYPPGSTIKPIIALASLETHVTSLSHKINCQGAFSLPGSSHRYRDWRPEGHQLVDMHDAIAQSCDVYFYALAPALGIDTMHEYLTRFGLGSLTGIDLSGEKAGLVPSQAWKRASFSRREDQSWFPGETVIASIGQGYLLATPLQLAHATAAIALRGKRVPPRIVRYIEDPASGAMQSPVRAPLDPVSLNSDAHWDAIIAAMQSVLQGFNGSARLVGVDAPYAMAGKSGTAQVFSVAQEDEYDEEELDERLRDHALFVAFAPVDEPRIAVAVVIENGSSGSRVAAPVARALTDYWLRDQAVTQSSNNPRP